ncbi:hypothetical protein SAMD00024442_29_17 [Candidatus Symbiothrix dinenymphae]|nr:hypothetical protein SAMD00024442_29_17 [Candidatus Symbiothrix dinenymphae]
MEIQLVQIQSKILEIRTQRVMLDFELSTMYGIETKRLKETVRRNIERFAGDDFMFELSAPEWEILRSQIATSSWGGSRYQPFAFTELGVAMLSSVLNHEDTRTQLELLNKSVAELQVHKKIFDKPRTPIGFRPNHES